MEVCKSEMISCAIEWQPSEAARLRSTCGRPRQRGQASLRASDHILTPQRLMPVLSYTLMGLSARSTTRSYLLGSVSMGTLAHTGWSFVPSALRQSMPVVCSAGRLRKVDLA
jgi:hypothetical protein